MSFMVIFLGDFVGESSLRDDLVGEYSVFEVGGVSSISDLTKLRNLVRLGLWLVGLVLVLCFLIEITEELLSI